MCMKHLSWSLFCEKKNCGHLNTSCSPFLENCEWKVNGIQFSKGIGIWDFSHHIFVCFCFRLYLSIWKLKENLVSSWFCHSKVKELFSIPDLLTYWRHKIEEMSVKFCIGLVVYKTIVIENCCWPHD